MTAEGRTIDELAGHLARLTRHRKAQRGNPVGLSTEAKMRQLCHDIIDRATDQLPEMADILVALEDLDPKPRDVVA